MASRSRALPRLLRHSGLGRSLAGFITVGFALVLGLTAGPGVFPRTQSPVAPAVTPVPAVALAGDSTAAIPRPVLPAEPDSRAEPEAVTQENSAAPVTAEAGPPATHPPCCSLPSSAVTAPQAGTPEGTAGLTAASPEPAGVDLEFTARLLDGTEFRLDEHRGRVVAIFPLTTGACGACIAHVRAWAEVASRYQPHDLVVLALVVVSLDTPEQVAAFAEMFGGNLAWALDPDGSATRRLGLRDLNQAVIVDREGRVAFRGYPPRDADALHQLIAPSSPVHRKRASA